MLFPSPKVSRNFELVGRVNLDQLEQMKGKAESSSSDEEEKEEEMSPKSEQRGQYCLGRGAQYGVASRQPYRVTFLILQQFTSRTQKGFFSVKVFPSSKASKIVIPLF